MNRMIVLAVLGTLVTVGTSSGLFAQEKASPDLKDSQEIESIVKEAITSLNERNYEGVMKHLHPLYTLYIQKKLDGPMRKKDLQITLKSLPPALKIRRSQPMDFQVRVSGDAAYATYRATIEIGAQDELIVRDVRVFDLFVRENGVWYVLHSHGSLVNENE